MSQNRHTSTNLVARAAVTGEDFDESSILDEATHRIDDEDNVEHTRSVDGSIATGDNMDELSIID